MAGGLIGTFPIHQWLGPAPALVKSQVDLIYRPGQATAAAKVLPNQSQESSFQSVTFVAAADAHTTAAGLRTLIGTVLALTYHGGSYGNALIKDVTIEAVEALGYVGGVHPDGSEFSYSPGARIIARWTIVRLA